jgi:hypothetical protein
MWEVVMDRLSGKLRMSNAIASNPRLSLKIEPNPSESYR